MARPIDIRLPIDDLERHARPYLTERRRDAWRNTPVGSAHLAQWAGVSARSWLRWRHEGVPLRVADRLAGALGMHVLDIWGDELLSEIGYLIEVVEEGDDDMDDDFTLQRGAAPPYAYVVFLNGRYVHQISRINRSQTLCHGSISELDELFVERPLGRPCSSCLHAAARRPMPVRVPS